VNLVLPGSVSMAGGLSIVSLDQEALQAISNDLKGDGLVRKGNIPPSPNADLLPSDETTEVPADGTTGTTGTTGSG
jgi:hypothetical protein